MRYEITTVRNGLQLSVKADRATAALLLREWQKTEPNETTCRDTETGICIVGFGDVLPCQKHTFRTTTPSGRPVCDMCGFEQEEPERDPGQRGDCPGHVWAYSGTAYGGDDESYSGEGRAYCEICGADGDA